MSGRPGLVPALAVGFAVLGVLLAAYFLAQTPDSVARPGPAQVAFAPGEPIFYTVEKDRSAADIGADLQRLGIVRSARQFELLVALMGFSRKLSAGDFEIESGHSTPWVVNALTVNEAVPTIRVTFPEGIRYEEMAAIAAKAGFGTEQEFLDAVARATLPAELGFALPEGQTLQGYLFPDTYILPVGSNMDALVTVMLRTFVRRFTPELREAALAQGVTLHQAVTLASIVEREAVLAAERPLIAGVFYNRLTAGDRLGADPTVQFAITIANPASVERFGWWKKELTLLDLDTDSPYNTRRVAGIPPGPIANPGLASLEAVAKPTKTKMYYFVADARKGDGSHVFAETLAEHERNQATVGTP